MANISCVLFDLGGVIVNWHNSWLIQDVSDEFQLQKEKLSKEYYKNLPKIATGKINEKEFINLTSSIKFNVSLKSFSFSPG